MTIKAGDKMLRQNVMNELEFEPSLDAANIGVAVEGGIVTLTGHVPTYSQKQKAEQAAWRVKGVKAIAQEIEVHIPSDRQTSDDDIARRAISMFSWNVAVPVKDIKIKVQHGWVTLDGEVEWNYQRDAAEKTVSHMSGVLGVSNNLALKTQPEVKTSVVKENIVNALKRQAELDASQINVSVIDGGVVSLQGAVRTWDERKAAEYAAWSTPGVRQVRDDLTLQVLQ